MHSKHKISFFVLRRFVFFGSLRYKLLAKRC
nr:MAG TPA: hypothetical protein [Caudoviricetes sp.]